jgi:hypothetical protein
MIKLLKNLALGCTLIVFFANCKRELNINHPIEESSQLTNEWISNPYKLNVVYFIPNDNDSVANYKQRISKILLDAQMFFADNLEREGFGRKSFGLDLLNDRLINIVTIMGQKGKDDYPYTGGGNIVMPEVAAYYAAHPSLKKSDHYLIILPSRSGNPMEPGGVPFYGTGKSCYALDYEYLDAQYLGSAGALGDLATKWIGGMIHELGHGLNAPHNFGTVSSVQTYGTALMGTGNSSYGKRKTFITQTSSAIFSNSQTFSTQVRADWDEDFDFKLINLSSSVINNKIRLSGKFSTSKTINYIAAYFDQEPFGQNKDYDAITFGSPTILGDSLMIECPLSDFKVKEGVYQLRLHFLAPNGIRKTEYFSMSFKNNTPDLQLVVREPLTDRHLWSVTSSGDQPSSPISNILDGNLNTNWHTPWSPTEKSHPHQFVIDTKNIIHFNTLMVYNRSNLNGALKDFIFEISNDGTLWETVGTFSLPYNAGLNYVTLPQDLESRYLRITSINSHGGFKYTNMAEFDVLLR